MHPVVPCSEKQCFENLVEVLVHYLAGLRNSIFALTLHLPKRRQSAAAQQFHGFTSAAAQQLTGFTSAAAQQLTGFTSAAG